MLLSPKVFLRGRDIVSVHFECFESGLNFNTRQVLEKDTISQKNIKKDHVGMKKQLCICDEGIL